MPMSSKGPLNKLGEGANGEVWRVGNKVMKIIKKFNPEKSKREFNFQKNAGNHGIAPKVRGNLKNFGNKTGAYLMNSLPKNTLTQMAYNAKKNNYLKIKENNLRHPHNRRMPKKQRKGLFNFN